MPKNKDWFDEALQMYKPGVFGYRKIANHFGISVKTVEARFLKYKKTHAITTDTTSDVDVLHAVLTAIKKPHSKKSLYERFSLSEKRLQIILSEIARQGYVLMDYGDTVRVATDYVENENSLKENWNGENVIRFGVVSDTHIGSKWMQASVLNKLYEIFNREGLDTVYHVGDITEGYNMRKGHEYEVFLHGADEQCDYVIKNYPAFNGKTRFIIGNHDLSHMKSGGIDVGRRIANERKDMEYLGALNAKVHLTPNCTMELNHPLDGASYALSYSIQKMIDSYGGGSKPSILLNGHHHKMFYLFYRNVHGVECGTTEAQSSWMKGKRIQAHIGGLIVTVYVHDDGTIRRFVPEFIPFYDEIKNDYIEKGV